MNDDILPTLRKLPLFRALNDRQLSALAGALEARHYPAGHVFSKTGQPGQPTRDTLFIILEGEISVRTGARAENQVPVERRLQPGDMFGLISFLTGGPRSATTEAAGPVHLASLGHTRYEQVIRADPALNSAFLFTVAGQLARDVRACNRRLTAAINRAASANKSARP